MVMKMNKAEFIQKLSEVLSYSKEKCTTINDILENNFFISKKNKDKIVSEFIQELNVDEREANNIYNTATKIINDEIKNKLKHPFRSKN